jgi:hypothetical protein
MKITVAEPISKLLLEMVEEEVQRGVSKQGSVERLALALLGQDHWKLPITKDSELKDTFHAAGKLGDRTLQHIKGEGLVITSEVNEDSSILKSNAEKFCFIMDIARNCQSFFRNNEFEAFKDNRGNFKHDSGIVNRR